MEVLFIYRSVSIWMHRAPQLIVSLAHHQRQKTGPELFNVRFGCECMFVSIICVSERGISSVVSLNRILWTFAPVIILIDCGHSRSGGSFKQPCAWFQKSKGNRVLRFLLWMSRGLSLHWIRNLYSLCNRTLRQYRMSRHAATSFMTVPSWLAWCLIINTTCSFC